MVMVAEVAFCADSRSTRKCEWMAGVPHQSCSMEVMLPAVLHRYVTIQIHRPHQQIAVDHVACRLLATPERDSPAMRSLAT